MSASVTPHSVNHIRVDTDGSEWIDGSTFRVTEIVLDHLAYGWSPEEICFQHYGQLTMAQIHAALAYYYDHQERIDAEIARRLEEIRQMRAEGGESPFRRRMRAEGKPA
jgi:uncharacterized protein (DUF433 family)